MSLAPILKPDEIREMEWYYAVELAPGVFTKGSEYINMIPTRKLMQRIEYSGLSVLDMGTMEGAFSMMLARAGAVVTAYDRELLGDRVALLKQVYECEFDYRTHDAFTSFARNVLENGPGPFDSVLFSGVLYHTISPGIFLHVTRTLLKTGGIMVLETACIVDDESALYFNDRGRFFPFTNYYQVSTQWLDYYLRILGFRIIDVEYVDPVYPDYDGKHLSRVAITCILDQDSLLEPDDGWGALGLVRNELEEFGRIEPSRPIDLLSRVCPARYQRDLYYENLPVRSLRLTDTVRAKKGLKLDRSQCRVRLDDSIVPLGRRLKNRLSRSARKCD